MDTTQLVNMKSAAKITGISIELLRHFVNKGRFVPIALELGGRRFFNIKDVKAWDHKAAKLKPPGRPSKSLSPQPSIS